MKSRAEIIEEVEDLATFFTLAASSADKEQKREVEIGSGRVAAFYEGKKAGFKTAFNKVDGILKDIKRR